MKILIVTPWFPRDLEDQQGNFIFDSVKALTEIGHEVVVLITTAWKPWQRNLPNNIIKYLPAVKFYFCQYFSIPHHYFSLISFYSYNTLVGKTIKKIIKEHPIEVIHAHTEYAGMPATKVGNELGVPSVITIHGISTEKKLYERRTRKHLFAAPLQSATRVVLVGSTLRSFAKQFVENDTHFRVIANGFRANSQHSIGFKKTWLPNSVRFISVSNLEEGKGIDINLKALARLNQSGTTNWTYTVVGNGSQYKFLVTLCSDLGLTKQVKFLGAIKHNEVYAQLNSADIFILPSYREAFGVAYLEAMSYGLLAIGVQTQGPEDFIQHEKTGFLAKPRDVDSLFEIIQSIHTTRATIMEIAEAGMNHVRQHFTWQNHAHSLTQLYNNLLGEHSCSTM